MRFRTAGVSRVSEVAALTRRMTAAGVSWGRKNRSSRRSRHQRAPARARSGASAAPGTLGHQHGNRLHRPGADLRKRGRDHVAHEIDAPGHQVLQGGGGAAIGHVGDVGAHPGIEQHAADMRRRAAAAGTELHLWPGCSRISNEPGETVDRKVLAHDQHLGVADDEPAGREVGRAVVERPLVDELAEYVRGLVSEQDRVAVGSRLGHRGLRPPCRRRQGYCRPPAVGRAAPTCAARSGGRPRRWDRRRRTAPPR